MSSPLFIRNVRLIAASRSYSWDLAIGINVIVGPVGVGKTSLLELIRWGLGGGAQLSPAVRKVGRQLALTVDVGDERLLLLRDIHKNKSRIAVHDSDGTPITISTTQNPGETNSISHILMEALQIPEVRVPRSRKNPAGKYTSVSFNDVYGYMYLSQSEIDRSTINHLDGLRDPKRQSTFEVIYGLIDVQVAQMQLELGELADLIESARVSMREVDAFVRALETPARPELEGQIRIVEGVVEARERELRQIREQMRDVSATAVDARREAEDLANQLTDAVARRERATSQIEDLQRLRSQIVLDEQRTVRSMLAGTELAAIEFHSCPRCLQDVGGRDVPEGRCILCGQAEAAAITSITLGDEVERLRGQLSESDLLVTDAERQLVAISTQVEHLQDRTVATRARADEQARDAVAPFVDRVAAVSEELGRLRGQLQVYAQALALHDELERRSGEADKLRHRQAELSDRLQEAQEEREQGLARIEELSEAFDGILQEFQLPWYEPSWIDTSNYLPIVGDKRLEELSSGGMKTLVNDAYFLAGLTYALRAPTETHLPKLMVIDTPRKNFGSDPDDRRAADRIYRWIRRLSDTYGPSSFQLILADNDLPSEAGEFNVIRLSYDQPLIDDLPHPGPDAVETLNPT